MEFIYLVNFDIPMDTKCSNDSFTSACNVYFFTLLNTLQKNLVNQ